MAAVPNRYGIGVFSPALDPFGNSAVGIQLLKDVVKELDADILNNHSERGWGKSPNGSKLPTMRLKL